VIDARGRDARGNGTATAKITANLAESGTGTQVTVVTELDITGKPAQFGRGVLNEVGGKLIGIFSDNLAKMLAAEQVQAPAPTTGEPVTGELTAGEPGAGELAAGEPATGAASGLSAAASASDELPPDPVEDDLAQPLEELALPVRAYNSLRKEGVHTVADLVAKTPQELLAIDNIGPASVEDIRQRLADRGLTLSEGIGAEGDIGTSANGARGPAAAFPAPEAAPGRQRAPLQSVPAGQAEPSWQAEDDAIDLLSVAGFPVLKRALPVAAGVIAIAFVALARRLRKRRSRR